jgi:hypothetical protein
MTGDVCFARKVSVTGVAAVSKVLRRVNPVSPEAASGLDAPS